jgi:metal-responsive CopG/Arc/MetJ family transcriptional regulator
MVKLRLTISIDQEILHKLQDISRKEDRSPSNMITVLIKKYTKEQQEKEIDVEIREKTS